MFRKFVSMTRPAAVLLLAALAGGCVERPTAPRDADDDAGAAPMDASVLARFERQDGSKVEFLGSESGIIMVVENWMDENSLAALRAAHPDPVSRYEALAHAPAPTLLVEAATRAAARMRSGDVQLPDAFVSEPAQADLSGRTPHIAGSDEYFQNHYCPDPESTPWDYAYCLTNRTGNAEFREPGGSMCIQAHCVGNGSTSIRLTAEYWDWLAGVWRTARSYTVEPGATSGRLWVDGFFTTLRSRVTYATGDTYHVTVYGDR